MVQKKKKTVVRRSRKTAINIDVQTKAQAEALVTYLQALKTHPGWMVMVQVMELNIDAFEESILSKMDVMTGAKLSEEQIDEYRLKRFYMKQLIEKPDEMIAQFKKSAGIPMPEYDPYAKGGEKSTDPMASTLKS